MSGPASRRAEVTERLTAGFLTSLPSTLRELFGLLDDDDENTAELVGYELERLASTAGSLGLTDIEGGARAVLEKLSGGTAQPRSALLAPLVRASRAQAGVSAFSPIALIGDPRVVSSVQGQDDGCCEPILGFGSVDALRDSLGVDWPQAIVIPADQAHEVESLAEMFDSDVYLYGASRDAAGRLAAVNVGAAGFVSEPLALPELLSHVRFVGSDAGRKHLVALVGTPDWSSPVASALGDAGLDVHESTELLEVATVMHGIYPEAVVLGPADADEQARAVAMMRTHNGRSHVALLAVGDASLYASGVDDVLGPDDDVAARVGHRLRRFGDFRRDRDDLTHIPNRAGVLEWLQRFAAWSERANQPLSVALVLAEGLTAAGEEHGREASNACRRHLAAALERGLRRVDLVGTMGGDLFVAGLVRCEQSEAEKRMDQIRDTFESRVHADRRLRNVTLSIGTADTLGGTSGLMLRAQVALDQARASASS